MATESLEEYILRPKDGSQIDVILEKVRRELTEEELAESPFDSEVAFKLNDILMVEYDKYRTVESAKEFYGKFFIHACALYAALERDPDVMEPYADCIMKLIRAMWEIDTKTGVDGPVITANMQLDECKRIAALLDADRVVFCNILARNLVELRPYLPAAVLFTEYCRVEFIFNNYQPPARTYRDVEKFSLDIKKSINYFDEVLENLEMSLQEPGEAKSDDSPAEPVVIPHHDVEYLCNECDFPIKGRLNEAVPACENCAKPTEK